MTPPTIDNRTLFPYKLPSMISTLGVKTQNILQTPAFLMPLNRKIKGYQVPIDARILQDKTKRVSLRPLYICILTLLLVGFLLHTGVSHAHPETESLRTAPNLLHTRTNVIRFDRITVEDGLSQNAVLTVVQDQRGFIWMGTEDGLNKYNGYDFVIYKHDPDDPTSIADNLVSKIYEDQQGVLWLGTRSGLDRYDPTEDTFTHFQNDPSDPTSLSGTWVVSIAEDRGGTLWIGTDDGGLNRFHPETETFTRYTHDPDNALSISNNSVRAIYEDSQGTFWVGTRDGLNRFNSQSQTFTHYKNAPDDPFSLRESNISAILEDEQGRAWIATEGSGLYYKIPTRNAFLQLRNDPQNPESLSHDRIRALLTDQAGNLWVGTQNGLDQLDPNGYGFIHFRHDPGDPHSLSSNSIWSIYEDRTGGLWFGTYGGGVSKYTQSGNKFTLYQNRSTNPNSLNDNMVWSICEDQLGALWIGTFNGGLNRLDPARNVFSHYRYNPENPYSLSNDDVRAILQDSSGRLWIGTSGGLDRFDAETGNFIHYRHDPENPNTLSENRVLVMLEDRSGTLWIGTRTGGLNRLDPTSGEFTRFQHDEKDETSLSDNRVWSLYEDRSGGIWVGTLGGLNLWDENKQRFIRYNHDPENSQSLSNDAVFSMYEDETGILWIGTWGDGLDRFDHETQTFSHYTEKDGLPNNVIYGIQADKDGNLWLSTNMGLSKFDPSTNTFKNYDVSDGLQNNEFNVGAHFKAPDGKLYFGGIQGFNSFYPDQVKDNPHIPPIIITSFAIFNQTIQTDLSDEEEIQLSYKDNYISFEFAALDYSAPEKNLYAYKLEGVDQDWIEAGTRRYASYTNLKGGDYSFRVKGSNNDGVWNEVGTSIRIHITPPFWETWWFIATVGVAILAITITGFRLRVKGVEARSTELEKLVEQRTHEIEHRTQELETLYRADEELYRHLKLGEVLQTLVDLAIDILKADKSSLFIWDEQHENLVVRAARGFRPETLSQMTFAPGEGIIGIVAESGEPIIVEDTHLDPRVATRITEPERIRSFMHFPIKIGEQVYGVFNADYSQPRGFGEDEQRLFSALAQRAASAIQNAQLYEAAQELAVVEERSRLARDLHDAVTQTLFSASLIAEVLPRIWERDEKQGQERLAELRELTRGALAEMRTLLLELRPTALMEADLGELLRQLAESITGRARVPVGVRIEGDCSPPPEVKVALYRIAQEALNNIAKHAAAENASISLSCHPTQIELEISDDGQGFNLSALSADSLGLGIMRERAERIKAHIDIKSQIGQGTTIHVFWNMSPEERLDNG